MKEKMIYHYGNEKSLLVMKQPHIPEMALAKGCPFAIANGTQILIAREKFDAYMDKAEKV